jgi:hypothetical protein
MAPVIAPTPLPPHDAPDIDSNAAPFACALQEPEAIALAAFAPFDAQQLEDEAPDITEQFL